MTFDLKKDEKIKIASQMLPQSPGMQANIVLSANEWAGILQQIDEDKIDDLLLLLEEEGSMISEVEKETTRKMEINTAKYLQRLEQLKLRAESLKYKTPNNG